MRPLYLKSGKCKMIQSLKNTFLAVTCHICGLSDIQSISQSVGWRRKTDMVSVYGRVTARSIISSANDEFCIFRSSNTTQAFLAYYLYHSSLQLSRFALIYRHLALKVIIMVDLCNRADHYIFALLFLSSIYLFFIPRLISAVADWMSTIL